MTKEDTQELFRRIDIGVRQGAAQAQAEHKRAGRSIFVWKDGQVVEVPPEEIQVQEKEEESNLIQTNAPPSVCR